MPKKNKDNTTLVLLFGIIAVIVMIVLGFIFTPDTMDSSPKVGDTWEFYSTGDPFDEDFVYVRKIIGIKEGYIQFIENDKDTLSRPEDVFLFNSKMLSRGTK